MIQLKDVKEIIEVNSTFTEGELKRKFVDFVNNFDSLGLKVDNFSIDLGGHVLENTEEDSDIAYEIPTESQQKDIPAVWVLMDDSDFPKFVPFKTDVIGTDYFKAITKYGIDIIELKTDFTEIRKSLEIRLGKERLCRIGTYRELQEFIINSFTVLECRQQLFDQLNSIFYEYEAINSFALTIPVHFIPVVISISSGE